MVEGEETADDRAVWTAAVRVAGEGTRRAMAGDQFAAAETWAVKLTAAVLDRLSRDGTRSLAPVRARRGGGIALSGHG